MKLCCKFINALIIRLFVVISVKSSALAITLSSRPGISSWLINWLKQVLPDQDANSQRGESATGREEGDSQPAKEVGRITPLGPVGPKLLHAPENGQLQLEFEMFSFLILCPNISPKLTFPKPFN